MHGPRTACADPAGQLGTSPPSRASPRASDEPMGCILVSPSHLKPHSHCLATTPAESPEARWTHLSAQGWPAARWSAAFRSHASSTYARYLKVPSEAAAAQPPVPHAPQDGLSKTCLTHARDLSPVAVACASRAWPAAARMGPRLAGMSAATAALCAREPALPAPGNLHIPCPRPALHPGARQGAAPLR